MKLIVSWIADCSAADRPSLDSELAFSSSSTCWKIRLVCPASCWLLRPSRRQAAFGLAECRDSGAHSTLHAAGGSLGLQRQQRGMHGYLSGADIKARGASCMLDALNAGNALFSLAADTGKMLVRGLKLRYVCLIPPRLWRHQCAKTVSRIGWRLGQT